MESLNDILARVLGIEKNSIKDDMSPDTVPGWDSFNALLLVSELEANFKVKFTMNEVTAVKCVKDIKDVLKRHNVKSA
jgi:acyl carrier protein